MSIEWFIRYSTLINRWTLRLISNRYKFSLGSILFLQNRKPTQICLNSWRTSHKHTNLFLSSLFGSLLSSVPVMFSWKNQGVSDQEL